MSAHTDIQIIKQNGRPAFVVVPYDEYVKTKRPFIPADGESVPHEVIGMTIKNGYSLIRAWREYLGMTQTEVASRMGITQPALSQIESGEKKVRKGTIAKLSVALGISIGQLQE